MKEVILKIVSRKEDGSELRECECSLDGEANISALMIVATAAMQTVINATEEKTNRDIKLIADKLGMELPRVLPKEIFIEIFCDSIKGHLIEEYLKQNKEKEMQN